MNTAELLQPTSDPTLDNFPGRNTGVLLGQRPTDFVAGKVSSLPFEVVNPSADWRDYQVRGEKQWYPKFDTMNCTGYANNNSAEIQLKFRTGMELNFSDRAMSVMAKCMPEGNYLYKPADVGRKVGRILEDDYPNDAGPPASWGEYNKALPADLLKKVVRFNETYEWVPTDKNSLRHHLRHAPILIVIDYGSTRHNVVLVHVNDEGYWYFDSYSPWLKLTTQQPSSALKVIVKPMTNAQFVHKAGTQEYGFYLPATTEESIKDKAKNLGLPIENPDGSVNFGGAKDVTGLS